jgi:menaquinol-cytochrome c reductase iron-sulfur subunit
MKPASHAAAAQRAPAPPTIPEPARRSFLEKALAGAIGLVVGVFPLASGLLVLLDPVLRKKKSGGDKEAKPYLRVAPLSVVPTDGTPLQVPVISDLVDAWNLERNQPIGAVYLIRDQDGVKAFNAICPHAGCFVGYAADRKCFQCPCHTSSFDLKGERILPSPSPRKMDELTIDQDKLKNGEVWVQFVNYYPGKEDQEEKK